MNQTILLSSYQANELMNEFSQSTQCGNPCRRFSYTSHSLWN